MTKARLIFLHIPKTGGTSVRSMLIDVYGEDRIGRPGRQWDRSVPNNPHYRDYPAYHGHFRFGLHAVIGVPCEYFTVLRDPIDRVLSLYWSNAVRKNRRTMSPAYYAWCKPVQANNLQTRMLSGASDDEPIGPEHVEQALQNLREHFIHVGFTSDLDATARWFQSRLGWKGSHAPRLNVTPGDKRLPESERQELERSTAVLYDRELYRRVCNGEHTAAGD